MSTITDNAFWMVRSPTGERPPKFRHETAKAAYVEAERLARLRPGQLFVVLEAVAAGRLVYLVRTQFVGGSNDIPF